MKSPLLILILALLCGCKTATVSPSKPAVAATKVQPPSPPGMAAMIATLKPVANAAVLPPRALFTQTIIWDTYSNNCASNLFIQGSDDGIVWTNEVEVVPIWITNSWKLTETHAKHFYRLMAQ